MRLINLSLALLGIDQKLYWPNAPNYTIMFNAAIGANYEGVHSRVIWNASLQHNVHMTKPGEYYSNVSTGDFLELLAIHNLLLDYDIDVRIQRVLGLTFTALLRKKA